MPAGSPGGERRGSGGSAGSGVYYNPVLTPAQAEAARKNIVDTGNALAGEGGGGGVPEAPPLLRMGSISDVTPSIIDAIVNLARFARDQGFTPGQLLEQMRGSRPELMEQLDPIISDFTSHAAQRFAEREQRPPSTSGMVIPEFIDRPQPPIDREWIENGGIEPTRIESMEAPPIYDPTVVPYKERVAEQAPRVTSDNPETVGKEYSYIAPMTKRQEEINLRENGRAQTYRLDVPNEPVKAGERQGPGPYNRPTMSGDPDADVANLRAELGREPTIEELRDYLNVAPNNARETGKVSGNWVAERQRIREVESVQRDTRLAQARQQAASQPVSDQQLLDYSWNQNQLNEAKKTFLNKIRLENKLTAPEDLPKAQEIARQRWPQYVREREQALNEDARRRSTQTVRVRRKVDQSGQPVKVTESQVRLAERAANGEMWKRKPDGTWVKRPATTNEQARAREWLRQNTDVVHGGASKSVAEDERFVNPDTRRGSKVSAPRNANAAKKKREEQRQRAVERAKKADEGD